VTLSDVSHSLGELKSRLEQLTFIPWLTTLRISDQTTRAFFQCH
jgi:hypothetical protein